LRPLDLDRHALQPHTDVSDAHALYQSKTTVFEAERFGADDFTLWGVGAARQAHRSRKI
jgi:hypothetical protein